MTTKLGNLVLDRWIDGDGDGNVLTSAVNGNPVASITSDGLDFGSIIDHARRVGGANLRQLTFHERGDMLKALAKYLMEHKQEFYTLSTETGATKADSWIDIDGGGALDRLVDALEAHPQTRVARQGVAEQPEVQDLLRVAGVEHRHLRIHEAVLALARQRR